MSPQEAMTAAIELLGSQTKLADAIGYTQTAVHFAFKSGRPSVMMAVLIERATGGRVTAAELRPDIFHTPLSTILTAASMARKTARKARQRASQEQLQAKAI
jgi:DNA-binding transcriptional regulator YdaS (Cro superfamily)